MSTSTTVLLSPALLVACAAAAAEPPAIASPLSDRCGSLDAARSEAYRALFPEPLPGWVAEPVEPAAAAGPFAPAFGLVRRYRQEDSGIRVAIQLGIDDPMARTMFEQLRGVDSADDGVGAWPTVSNAAGTVRWTLVGRDAVVVVASDDDSTPVGPYHARLDLGAVREAIRACEGSEAASVEGFAYTRPGH